MTKNPSPISAPAGLRSVQLDLPLPVAIFAGLSTCLAFSGLVFLASVLVGQLLQAVLP